MTYAGRSCFALIVLFLISAVAAEAQTPEGYWRTIDDDTNEPRSIVHVFEQDGELHGKVVEILSTGGEVTRNEEGKIICNECDGERHNQPIEGMVILWGLERSGDRWDGGRILDPSSGSVYRLRMELDGDDELRVRGYRGISAFGRTQVWHRISEDEVPS